MRIRLLIDIETDDLPRLQEYVGEQPLIELRAKDGWQIVGRFVGAKEALDGLDDPALKDTYDRQIEREQQG